MTQLLAKIRACLSMVAPAHSCLQPEISMEGFCINIQQCLS